MKQSACLAGRDLAFGNGESRWTLCVCGWYWGFSWGQRYILWRLWCFSPSDGRWHFRRGRQALALGREGCPGLSRFYLAGVWPRNWHGQAAQVFWQGRALHYLILPHPHRASPALDRRYFRLHPPADMDIACATERCRSGRTGRSRKPLSLYGDPGFESLSLRHPHIILYFPIFTNT
jgi:hypothetical protein